MIDEPLHFADGEPGGYTATVLSPPASPADELRIRVHAFDGHTGRGQVFTARWAPRYAGSPLAVVLPQKGDEAVVVFDEAGEAWCPVVWPS